MDNVTLNELEFASKSVVMSAARGFSEALTETPQFREFEEAYQAFHQDQQAQSAYKALQNKQQSLRMMLMLNSVDEKERQELQQREEDFYRNDTVTRFIRAQETLISLCQEIGDIISDAAGLNFGLACNVGGCCG